MRWSFIVFAALGLVVLAAWGLRALAAYAILAAFALLLVYAAGVGGDLIERVSRSRFDDHRRGPRR